MKGKTLDSWLMVLAIAIGVFLGALLVFRVCDPPEPEPTLSEMLGVVPE